MAGVLWLLRVVAVIALLGLAAAIATPKGRLPLALRGVRRILRKDAGLGADDPAASGGCVSARQRAIAFLLVLAAVALAVI